MISQDRADVSMASVLISPWICIFGSAFSHWLWIRLCNLLWPMLLLFSHVWLFVTLWTAAPSGFPVLHYLRVCSNSCPLSQWCHSTISSSVTPSPPAFNLFQHQGLFKWVKTLLMRWPKYWNFSFNISPSNEHPGLISFRVEWLDLLAVQGTLKSLLQHHSSKASILQRSAFFTVQLCHPYMTTGKTIALTRRTFVDKVMSLLFNMLTRLVIS